MTLADRLHIRPAHLLVEHDEEEKRIYIDISNIDENNLVMFGHGRGEHATTFREADDTWTIAVDVSYDEFFGTLIYMLREALDSADMFITEPGRLDSTWSGNFETRLTIIGTELPLEAFRMLSFGCFPEYEKVLARHLGDGESVLELSALIFGNTLTDKNNVDALLGGLPVDGAELFKMWLLVVDVLLNIWNTFVDNIEETTGEDWPDFFGGAKDAVHVRLAMEAARKYASEHGIEQAVRTYALGIPVEDVLAGMNERVF